MALSHEFKLHLKICVEGNNKYEINTMSSGGTSKEIYFKKWIFRSYKVQLIYAKNQLNKHFNVLDEISIAIFIRLFYKISILKKYKKLILHPELYPELYKMNLFFAT